MAKIKTYARLKPSGELYDDYECTRNRLYLRIPNSYNRHTLYNRNRAPITNHEFKYNQVFGVNSTQAEVFDSAAKSIIDGFLEGYNGTIFAYGQTGSGKTYTMEGELSSHSHRGLSPRSLTTIFDALSARKANGEIITVQVSFLEIYQEVGYDLLKLLPRDGPGPASFAKVTVVDGVQGNAIIKNLSLHTVTSEETAQALLTQGEQNRKVAETSMNQRSSRSHAVFSVYLSSKRGDLIVKSKMHFVDLAGSERVCKTGVKGLQLSEAKYINLSLHYLEGVIIALQQEATSSRLQSQTAPAGMSKSWSPAAFRRPFSAFEGSVKPKHIPYRNSLLTMVLKDSLGGNCLTAMIATVSLQLSNLSESVSTCRFAQRVSCISNVARKNEEIDDKCMIKRLRTRVAELEAENSILKQEGGISGTDEIEKPCLSQEDKDLCMVVVKDFLNGKVMDPIMAGVTDPHKFRECMKIFKKLIIEYNTKSVRLAEQLKQQPRHVQEAFYTGGSYHEAPLAKPSRKPDVTFRDDANALARRAYTSHSSSRPIVNAKPTILRSRTDTAEQGKLKSAEGKSRAQRELMLLALQDKVAAMEKAQEQAKIRRKKQSDLTDRSSKPDNVNRPVTTPYEKKKVKEITQLNKKVEAHLVEQLQQAENLKAFKKSVAEQEYEVLEDSLKRKLELTRHQMADQNAYIIRLKKQSENDDLLLQEKLVLKQLCKREEKIATKLKMVRGKLEEMRERDNIVSSSIAPRIVSDKFAAHQKSDGRFDTVKAMNTLQTQNKMQQKIQEKIDKQRVLVMEKQIAVKEMSTRQKLEEFKRKLELSKQTNDSREQKYNQSEPAVHSEEIIPAYSSVQPKHEISHSNYNESQKSNMTVDEIMAKYLGNKSNPSKQRSAEQVPTNQHSAQTVDSILAKYRRRKADSSSQSKCSPTSSKRSNDDLSAKIPSSQTSKYQSASKKNIPGYSSHYSRELEFNHKSNQFTNSKNATETNLSRKIRYQTELVQKMEDKLKNTGYSGNERKFDATLRSMLESRGFHKQNKRDWKSSATHRNRFTAAISEEEEHTKHQEILAKQHKGRGGPEIILGKPHSRTSASQNTDKQDIQPKSKPIKSVSVTDEKSYKKMLKYTTQFNKRNEEIQRFISTQDKDLSLPVQGGAPVRTSGYRVKTNTFYLTNVSKRNEHINKIRQTQNAAKIIQRAWRKYKKQTVMYQDKRKGRKRQHF